LNPQPSVETLGYSLQSLTGRIHLAIKNLIASTADDDPRAYLDFTHFGVELSIYAAISRVCLGRPARRVARFVPNERSLHVVRAWTHGQPADELKAAFTTICASPFNWPLRPIDKFGSSLTPGRFQRPRKLFVGRAEG
jgi:hypothetical protein